MPPPKKKKHVKKIEGEHAKNRLDRPRLRRAPGGSTGSGIVNIMRDDKDAAADPENWNQDEKEPRLIENYRVDKKGKEIKEPDPPPDDGVERMEPA